MAHPSIWLHHKDEPTTSHAIDRVNRVTPVYPGVNRGNQSRVSSMRKIDPRPNPPPGVSYRILLFNMANPSTPSRLTKVATSIVTAWSESPMGRANRERRERQKAGIPEPPSSEEDAGPRRSTRVSRKSARPTSSPTPGGLYRL